MKLSVSPKFPPEHWEAILKSGRSIVKLGRGPELGSEHEKRLVAHIKSLEKIGFSTDATAVKNMAYKFAEKLNINMKSL